jgi:hypothetical protein
MRQEKENLEITRKWAEEQAKSAQLMQEVEEAREQIKEKERRENEIRESKRLSLANATRAIEAIKAK